MPSITADDLAATILEGLDRLGADPECVLEKALSIDRQRKRDLRPLTPAENRALRSGARKLLEAVQEAPRPPRKTHEAPSRYPHLPEELRKLLRRHPLYDWRTARAHLRGQGVKVPSADRTFRNYFYRARGETQS